MMETNDFLGLSLANLSVEEFLEEIAAKVGEKRAIANDEKATEFLPHTIAYLNAHTTNLTQKDTRFCELIKRCSVVYPDGMGVVWGAKFLGIPQKERVNAGDFLPDFFAQCIARKHRVALVGGHPDEAEQTTAALREMLPDLPDVFHRDGFFTEDNEPEILQQLAEFQPDIILIGRGSPRQEETMFRWLETADYQPAVYWCVGALFEYFSGNRYRAPVWVRKLGFEWLVRLILEPRRLARRYLIGNVTFIWHIVCGKLRR